MTLELEFEEPGWRRAIDALPTGTAIPAQRFFAILGAVTEDEASEAAAALEQRQIAIDVSSLPPCQAGQAAQRLSLEQSLVSSGTLPQGLASSDPLRLHWQSLEQLPRLCEAEAQILVSQAAGSAQLVEGLLYLVLEEAPQFAGQGVLLLDLMQEGALGLMHWAQTPHAPVLGNARWCIRQAMACAVALQYFVSGEAQRLVTAMREYQQADRQLLQRLGRNPVVEELAQELGKSVSQTQLLEKMVEQAAKLPQAQPQAVAEEAPEAVEDSAYFQLRSRVEALLSALEDTDRQLLTLRFGLSGKAPMSQQEAAQQLGMTAEEAQRRELSAIALLRQQEC